MAWFNRTREKFPITITPDDIAYAHEQSKAYLTFPFVGWFQTQFRTEWEATLNSTPAGDNFLGNMRHRIVHDYSDSAKVQTAVRDLEEARHMAYALSIVYAAIFSALGKKLPPLSFSMVAEYFKKPENLGLMATNRFLKRLQLFSDELGLEASAHVNRSGVRSLGGTNAKAFIEVLFDAVETEVKK